MLNESFGYETVCRSFVEDFFYKLPRNVETSIDKERFFYIDKKIAVNNPWIQINHKNLTSFLIIDIDHHDAYSRYIDSGLPCATYISINRKNGHLQLGWKLKDPVSTSPNSRPEPIRFLKAIRQAFDEKLGGDANFSMNVAKNPLHEMWHNEYFDCEYSLGELSDYVDLCKKVASVPSRENLDDNERNVSLFDVARKWAYRMIRTYDEKPQYRAWESLLLSHCEELSHGFNSLDDFSYREILSIARSIANYTYGRWSEYVYSSENFKLIQSARGKKGGLISKRGASTIKARLLPIVKALANDKTTHRVIANLCKISPSTVSRWLVEDRKDTCTL